MIKISRLELLPPINQSSSNYNNPKKILITGGVGDIFSIESHFPQSWYDSVEKIVLATRASEFVYEFFKNKKFPFNKASIEVVEADYKQPVHNIRELLLRTNYTDVNNLVDCSISKIFPLIRSNKFNYKGSSLLTSLDEDLSRFKLPEKYIVICPITNHDIRSPRNLLSYELQVIENFLKNKKLVGIVLHHEKHKCMINSNIINLSGMTSIAESICILKKASGFISVDSCMAVLACQLFQPEQMIIKSNNKQYYNNIKPYTNPLNTRKMVFQQIHPYGYFVKPRNGLIALK